MITSQTIRTYSDIDWSLLWKNARSAKSSKGKTADHWSKKASAFAKRVKKTPFSELFLDLVQVDHQTTILDVGCGPGTLALPLAARACSVTALDYASGMIAELKKEARRQEIVNIRALNCSWEDDWSACGISTHDIAIAARSLNIENLEAGLRKLDSHARKQVIIVDRIGSSPFDPDLFTALKRELNPGPDYIYTINILYRLGIHPRIEHIELPSQTHYRDFDEAVAATLWMLKDITPEEELLLHNYLKSRIIYSSEDGIVIKRRTSPRWAVLSWDK
ncbi:MAG: SAM-dependent methyltransferase [Proteobacteria bacterium]|nr:MAG: SAM-dependent methyltransferase [Pseudomonadota bacterium]PIE65259.1 MAG: SAM-dependent methyltransferase [Desulfobacterales bacterium]